MPCSAVPLATAAFPRLAEHAATGDLARYGRLVAASTRAILLVSAVGAAALVAAAPAVAAVFAAVDASRDPDALAAMTPALVLLAPGLFGYALIFQLSRVLFALERGRAAVTAVATGWLAVVAASTVAVLALTPATGDGPWDVARARPRQHDRHDDRGPRAPGRGPPGRWPGRARGHAARPGRRGRGCRGRAVAGRWVADAALALTDGSELSGVVTGAGGAALAGLIVIAACWLLDRSTIVGAFTADRPTTRPLGWSGSVSER